MEERALSFDTCEKETCSTDGGEKVAEHKYLQGWQLGSLMLLLMLGQFIIGLDSTVITTALPRITAEFHSLTDVGWYGSIYLIAVTATQPTWGKIFTCFNIKWTFIVGVVIFELGSVVCALATSSAVLIVGRAIAGVGRSALHAGGTIVVGYRVPLEKRPLYFAILQSMNGIASVCGPPLGGIFTDSTLTWRFSFWINVRILLIIAGLSFFQEPKRAQTQLPLRRKLLSLDIPGAVLFTASMVCLFIALETGQSVYDWSDSRTWGWLIGFAVGICSYAYLQHQLGDMASIPSRIFSRPVVLGCIYTAFLEIGFGVHTYFLPFYFQSAKGTSAEQSGLYLVPYLASIMVVSLVVGGVLVATGALTRCMLVGGAVFTVGSGLLTILQPSSGPDEWVSFQFLVGMGYGSSVQLSLVAIQSAVATEDMGIGNGVWLLSNFAGGSLGIALAETIFLNVLQDHLANIASLEDPQRIVDAGATAITSVVPMTMVSAVQGAYDIAITRAFVLPVAAAAIGTCCMFAMREINLKEKK